MSNSDNDNYPVQHTVRLTEEDSELNEWIDEAVGDVFRSRSHLYKKAMYMFKEDKGAEVESLKHETDDEMI